MYAVPLERSVLYNMIDTSGEEQHAHIFSTFYTLHHDAHGLYLCTHVIIVHPVLFFFSCLLVDLFLFVSGSMPNRCTRTNFCLAYMQLHLYTTVYRPETFFALLSFFFR